MKRKKIAFFKSYQLNFFNPNMIDEKKITIMLKVNIVI